MFSDLEAVWTLEDIVLVIRYDWLDFNFKEMKQKGSLRGVIGWIDLLPES